MYVCLSVCMYVCMYVSQSVSQSVSAYPCPSTAGMMVDPRHNITLTPIAGNLHTRNARAPAINPQQVTPREQHAIGKSKMVVGRESGVSKQAKSTQETKETNYQASFKRSSIAKTTRGQHQRQMANPLAAIMRAIPRYSKVNSERW